MQDDNPQMQDIFVQAAKNPRARSLPVDAFILAPVQRLARYPLLVQAVASRTEKGKGDSKQLDRCLAVFSESVRVCNARLRALEDHALLQRLDAQMDYSRIDKPPSLVKR